MHHIPTPMTPIQGRAEGRKGAQCPMGESMGAPKSHKNYNSFAFSEL